MVVVPTVFRILLCVTALSAEGCGLFQNSAAPTTTTTENPNETFSGTMEPKGSSIFTFTVTRVGNVSVTLASLSPSSIAAVGLGIGTSSGTTGGPTTCTPTTSTENATAGPTAQLTVTQNPGTYCLKVYDVGLVATTATFTIKITHP